MLIFLAQLGQARNELVSEDSTAVKGGLYRSVGHSDDDGVGNDVVMVRND